MALAVLIADNAFVGAVHMFRIATLAADACIERVDDPAMQEQIAAKVAEYNEANFSTDRGAERRLAKISSEIVAACAACPVIDDPRPWGAADAIARG